MWSESWKERGLEQQRIGSRRSNIRVAKIEGRLQEPRKTCSNFTTLGPSADLCASCLEMQPEEPFQKPRLRHSAAVSTRAKLAKLSLRLRIELQPEYSDSRVVNICLLLSNKHILKCKIVIFVRHYNHTYLNQNSSPGRLDWIFPSTDSAGWHFLKTRYLGSGSPPSASTTSNFTSTTFP